MANRSYLYTHHPDEPNEYRDLSEWKYDPPISHFLLVGANPTPCRSAIWEVDAKIAIQGDASASRPVFLDFLDWLAPQIASAEFDDAVAEARQHLSRSDRQGKRYHLELGEIYELEGLELEDMESTTRLNAKFAGNLFAEVCGAIQNPGTTFDDLNNPMLKRLKDDWESQLGLYFAQTLYFHLGN